MNYDELLSFLGRVILYLGGATGIVGGLVLLCGNKLSEMASKKIALKYDEILEQYKADIERETNKLNALTERVMHISKLHYEKEFSFYNDIWTSLSDCDGALTELVTFHSGNNTEVRGEAYEQKVKSLLNVYKEKLCIFARDVERGAPFYQENIYNKLGAIRSSYDEILKKSMRLTNGSATGYNATIDNIRSEWTETGQKIHELQREIRLYLQGLSMLNT